MKTKLILNYGNSKIDSLDALINKELELLKESAEIIDIKYTVSETLSSALIIFNPKEVKNVVKSRAKKVVKSGVKNEK